MARCGVADHYRTRLIDPAVVAAAVAFIRSGTRTEVIQHSQASSNAA